VAGQRKEKIPGRRVLYNLGAPQVQNYKLHCATCHQVKEHKDLVVGQLVDCTCGKQYDCVWYRPVSNPKELQDYVDAAMVVGKQGVPTAYDYETDGDEDTGNDEFTHNLVGTSFCRHDQRGTAIYVPLRHAVGENMDEQVFKEIVAPFMRVNPMSVYSASYMEWPWTLVKLDVEPNIVEDGCIAAYLEDPNRTWRHDPRSLKLKEVTKELFEIDVIELMSLVDLKTNNFSHVPVGQAFMYGCQDSDITVMVLEHVKQKKVHENQRTIWKLEHELIPVIGKMHLRGITLNPDHLVEGAKELDAHIEQLEQETFSLMGFEVKPNEDGYWERPIDLGSNQKVSQHLFHKMGLPYDQKSVGKNGYPSVSKESIQDLADDYPVVEKLLELKGEIHSRDNYVVTLPTYVNAVTGAIHGYFNQTGAPTGRFSHSQPNLANQAKIQD
jgi:DNA polymerase I-like protein with 3'-5' exonuclease and polymerase domains